MDIEQRLAAVEKRLADVERQLAAAEREIALQVTVQKDPARGSAIADAMRRYASCMA